MAVTPDANLGTAAAQSINSVSLVIGAAVAAGATIIAIVGRFSVTPAATLSVTGAAGLAWTQDQTNTSGGLRVSVFRALAPAGLASGSTITISNSGGASDDWLIGAGSFLGVETVAPVRASGGAGASTAGWSSGSVAASAGDFLIGGAFEDGAGTATSLPTSPAVELFDRNQAAQTEAITAAYKLSVAGADSIAGTWSTAVGHVAAAVAYKAAAGGPSTQNVTGAGAVGSGEAIGSATVAPGPVSVGPSGVASAQAFGTARLDLNVSPTGIASGQALGTPAVTPGPVTVSPGGIASGEAVGQPVVGGGVSSAGGIASAEAVGVPTITVGPVTVSPTGIPSGEAIGLATVGGGTVTAAVRQLPTLMAG